jgi:hypothetical protein
VSGSFDHQPTWSLLLEIKKGNEIQKIFISETTAPIGTKLCLNSPWMTPFQIVSGNPDIQPTWPLLLKIEKGDRFLKFHPRFIFLVTATMLVGGRNCRTQFWKGITHGPFHQSLVLSGQVVSEENIFSKNI